MTKSKKKVLFPKFLEDLWRNIINVGFVKKVRIANKNSFYWDSLHFYKNKRMKFSKREKCTRIYYQRKFNQKEIDWSDSLKNFRLVYLIICLIFCILMKMDFKRVVTSDWTENKRKIFIVKIAVWKAEPKENIKLKNFLIVWRFVLKNKKLIYYQWN